MEITEKRMKALERYEREETKRRKYNEARRLAMTALTKAYAKEYKKLLTAYQIQLGIKEA